MIWWPCVSLSYSIRWIMKDITPIRTRFSSCSLYAPPTSLGCRAMLTAPFSGTYNSTVTMDISTKTLENHLGQGLHMHQRLRIWCLVFLLERGKRIMDELGLLWPLAN